MLKLYFRAFLFKLGGVKILFFFLSKSRSPSQGLNIF